MIYKSIPEIEQVFLGSTAIGKIFNGSDLVFGKENDDPYSGDYIIFSDPDVKSIIVNEYGDTTIGEITYGQAAAVTTFMSGSSTTYNPFYNNTDVDSFDEFKYFTGVTSIGLRTFEGSYLRSIKIPNSVTYIGQEAFENCTYLQNVSIPNTVSSIGHTAFMGCTALPSINIPNSVTTIESWAFWGCESLTSVTIGNSVTSIGELAFYKCYSLTSVNIPNSVTYIGGNAFLSCHDLSSANIPNSVSTINEGVFSGCESLTSIIIPNSVTSIGKHAFYQCLKLNEITIPANVTYIGDGAFLTCRGLTSITCKATTPPTLGVNVFNDTNSCPIYVPTQSVALFKSATGWSTYYDRIQAIPTPNIVFADSDVKSIIVSNYGSNGEITEGQAAAVTTFMSGTNTETNPFYNNTDVDSFTEFSYFTGLTEIGASTFRGCSNLQSIVIPESVTTVKGSAFAACSKLTSVTFPASVTSLGVTILSNCSSLTSITCKATTPPTLAASTFSNSTNCPIYVPAASVDTYKAAERWSSIASRIQAIPA